MDKCIACMGLVLQPLYSSERPCELGWGLLRREQSQREDEERQAARKKRDAEMPGAPFHQQVPPTA